MPVSQALHHEAVGGQPDDPDVRCGDPRAERDLVKGDQDDGDDEGWAGEHREPASRVADRALLSCS